MSEDIKVTDGTVLEAINGKVDLDGGNYKGSPLETYINEDVVTYNELEEFVCVTETYVNGTNGYRIWSDNFCEQWGRSTGGTSYTGTYLKPFKDTNYNFVTGEVVPSSTDTDGFDMTTGVSNLTTTGFRLTHSSDRRTHWRACGYIA